jgi:Spy/CpxP family protein refolding chaperone
MVRKLFLLTPVVALAVVLMVADTSLAQRQGRGGRGGFGGRGMMGDPGMMLLANEAVQKELELVGDQKDAIEKLSEDTRAQMRELFQGGQDLSPEERREQFEKNREKMTEITKATQTKLNTILLPNQVERLKQLNLQLSGLRALDNEEVAKALNITDDQKSKLTAVREEGGEKMRELFQGGQDLSPDERREQFEKNREKMTELRKEQEEKTLAVLTPEQKEQFEKMKGEKFEFPEEMTRFGGFGGRGFGGPGGGGRRRGGANN